MNQDTVKTNPTLLNRILRYGPLIIWFGLIFYASTDHLSNDKTSNVLFPFLSWLFFSPSESTLEILHIIIRKAAHFIEYAILAFFLARALRSSTKSWLTNNWFLFSFTSILIYALLDEFHQSFVITRMASIYDCIIDILGGLTVLLILHWKQRKAKTSQERLLAKT